MKQECAKSIIDSSVLYIPIEIPFPSKSKTGYFVTTPYLFVNTISNLPGSDTKKSVALY